MSVRSSLPRLRRHSLPLGTAACAAAAAVALATTATAQINVRQLLDVDPTLVGRSSNPEFGAELPNGICIFAATDAAHGREVWRTRSGADPVLLKDILAGSVGSHPRDFVLFRGEVWFSATDGQNGRELWKTDGTAAGTVLVADLVNGSGGSAPSGLAVQGNLLFFSAFDDQAGREPHVSNGTPAGTRLLKDVNQGGLGSQVDEDSPHVFVPSDVGTTVFFGANDGVAGTELWKTDGTTAGTVLVKDIEPGPDGGFDPRETPTVLNGTLFFRADDGVRGLELHKSDGTTGGTILVKDLRAGSSSGFPTFFTVHQGKVYFSAVDTTRGRELFETNGTAVGTTIVADIRAGSSSSNPSNLASCGNLLFFSASSDQVFTEPHISDGTATGTRVLADVNPGVFSSLPDNFTCCGNLVFFSARTRDEGDELFVTDGRVGNVTLLGDFLPGVDFGDPEDLFCCNGKLVGAVTTPDGREMVESDGTVGGTRVVDLDPTQTTASSNARSFRGVDLTDFYFIATTTLHGAEVFFSDGNINRAIEVVIGRDGSAPRDLVVVGDTAYWTSQSPTAGRELFRSVNGGPAELVADLRPGLLSSSLTNLIALDNRTLVCRGRTPNQGTELIVARNGQPGVEIFDIRAGGSSSSPSNLTKLIDSETGAAFIVFTATDDAIGNELFAFNGVNVQVAVDFNPGSSGSSARKFLASPDNTEILLEAFFNGTTTLVRLTVDENPSGLQVQFIPQALAALGRSFVIQSLLFAPEAVRRAGVQAFAIVDDTGARTTGPEPRFLDAQGNFQLIRDVNQGADGSDSEFLGVSENGLIMTAKTTEGEIEVFTYDFFTDSFVKVDVMPGGESSNPEQPAQVGDGALFAASTTVDAEQELVYVQEGQSSFVTANVDGVLILDPVDLGFVVIAGAQDPQANGGVEPVAIEIDTARASKVGTPCDGRAQHTVSTPKIGRQVTWRTIGGQLGDLGFVLIGLPPTTTVQLFGCDVYVGLNSAINAFAGTAPSFEASAQIANDTALIGLALMSQGTWVPTNGDSPRFTNGVFLKIGN